MLSTFFNSFFAHAYVGVQARATLTDVKRRVYTVYACKSLAIYGQAYNNRDAKFNYRWAIRASVCRRSMMAKLPVDETAHHSI